VNGVRERLRLRSGDVGVPLSSTQLEQLERYFVLLTRWNPRINLTSLPLDSLSDSDFDRLFVESIAATGTIQDTAVAWVDLGSGGGSPAIPLKVVKPELDLTLVEAKARKCAFLREVVRTLQLGETTVLQTRIEELPGLMAAGSVDLLTTRAIRLEGGIVDACLPLLSPNGRWLAFGSAQPPSTAGEGLILEMSQRLATNSRAWLHVYRGKSL
jgi:16S rRNA (guanine527-N7)-methyltransferase